MEPTSVTIDDAAIVDAAIVVSAVERQVPYLRIALAVPAEEGWLGSADLIEDRGLLLRQIDATQEGRGAPDLQVTASLWCQGYAFRAALPVVAPFALGLPGLSAEPAATYVRIARNRPAAVAVTDAGLQVRSAEQAAFDLLSGHLSPVIEAVSDVVTVGRRLLWGNAAASIATVLRALEGASGADRLAVRDRAEELLEQAQPWLAGLGGFEVLAEAGQEGWYWTRTNCCLYERCDGAQRCDDCSLIPARELEAARRSALIAAGSEVIS